MQAITEELLKKLQDINDIEAFLKANRDKFISKNTTDYLNELINVKGISIASVAKASGAGEYVYKVFSGSRKPSRDITITIAFGMKLSLDETQFLLRISKFAMLDSRNKRDSIIIYALSHNMTVAEVDDLLYKESELTLN